MRLFGTLVLLASPTLGHAAEVTDLPPRFRGDVHVRYDGTFQQVGLEEDGSTVAIRNVDRHEVGLRAEVAVHTGVAITLGLPITARQHIAYAAAREMVYEPLASQGSYTNGPRIPESELPSVSGGGVQGVWIGIAGAPFREDYDRGFPITTRFDLAFRTPAPGSTLYGERRGGAPGGWGVLLAGAFSVRRGRTEPYLSFDWQHETGVDVDVAYLGGASAADVRVDPTDRVDVRVGAELIALDQPKQGHRFAFDLWAGFGYRSPEERPSGFWLPDVLELTHGVPVTRSEYLQVSAGLALDAHISRYVGLRFGAEGRYLQPHRVEHPYDARTDGQSFEVGWTAAIVGRIRLKDDR